MTFTPVIKRFEVVVSLQFSSVVTGILTTDLPRARRITLPSAPPPPSAVD